ncbi:SufD family Fe-S cluster assembly protein, partial [Acinetobacter baumannii]
MEHTKIQCETENAFHIATVEARQEGNSVYTSNTVGLGAAIGRNDVNLWLNGEHTESWLNGVHVGKGEQVLDNHTRI